MRLLTHEELIAVSGAAQHQYQIHILVPDKDTMKHNLDGLAAALAQDNSDGISAFTSSPTGRTINVANAILSDDPGTAKLDTDLQEFIADAATDATQGQLDTDENKIMDDLKKLFSSSSSSSSGSNTETITVTTTTSSSSSTTATSGTTHTDGHEPT